MEEEEEPLLPLPLAGRGLSRVRKGVAAGVRPKEEELWKVRGFSSERSLRVQEEAEVREAGAAAGLQVKALCVMAMPLCSSRVLALALALALVLAPLAAEGTQSSSMLTVEPTGPWNLQVMLTAGAAEPPKTMLGAAGTVLVTCSSTGTGRVRKPREPGERPTTAGLEREVACSRKRLLLLPQAVLAVQLKEPAATGT
jgi:hypothetical protein